MYDLVIQAAFQISQVQPTFNLAAAHGQLGFGLLHLHFPAVPAAVPQASRAMDFDIISLDTFDEHGAKAGQADQHSKVMLDSLGNQPFHIRFRRSNFNIRRVDNAR